jgi:hypothetical protein
LLRKVKEVVSELQILRRRPDYHERPDVRLAVEDLHRTLTRRWAVHLQQELEHCATVKSQSELQHAYQKRAERRRRRRQPTDPSDVGAPADHEPTPTAEQILVAVRMYAELDGQTVPEAITADVIEETMGLVTLGGRGRSRSLSPAAAHDARRERLGLR